MSSGPYQSAKDNAKRRGISFELTFEEWLDIWTRSGKLHERGRGKNQYVMARFGDKGPYALGNVKIITAGDNVRETEWTEERIAAARLRVLGKKHALGHRDSPETRRRKSIAMMGNTNSVGRTYDAEARKKLSLAHKGITHAEATKAKMAEIRRDWWRRKREAKNNK